VVAALADQPADNGQVALRIQFLKTGQIGGDFRNTKRFVNKRFLRPRTAEIVKPVFIDNAQNAIIDQPGRRSESIGLSSGQLFKTADPRLKPFFNPLLRFFGRSSCQQR